MITLIGPTIWALGCCLEGIPSYPQAPVRVGRQYQLTATIHATRVPEVERRLGSCRMIWGGR